MFVYTIEAKYNGMLLNHVNGVKHTNGRNITHGNNYRVVHGGSGSYLVAECFPEGQSYYDLWVEVVNGKIPIHIGPFFREALGIKRFTKKICAEITSTCPPRVDILMHHSGGYYILNVADPVVRGWVSRVRLVI